MALPDPIKCYPVIYNDTRDLYSKIIKDFVETFGDVYLHSNTYEDLISKKITNEVLRGGLPRRLCASGRTFDRPSKEKH